MTDLSQIDAHNWNVARQRAEVLRSLAALKQCPRHLAHKAAQLNLSIRQIYSLIKRLRQNDTLS